VSGRAASLQERARTPRLRLARRSLSASAAEAASLVSMMEYHVFLHLADKTGGGVHDELDSPPVKGTTIRYDGLECLVDDIDATTYPPTVWLRPLYQLNQNEVEACSEQAKEEPKARRPS
jgi:hypothetical protein